MSTISEHLTQGNCNFQQQITKCTHINPLIIGSETCYFRLYVITFIIYFSSITNCYIKKKFISKIKISV